jgi:hypothetical protein
MYITWLSLAAVHWERDIAKARAFFPLRTSWAVFAVPPGRTLDSRYRTPVPSQAVVSSTWQLSLPAAWVLRGAVGRAGWMDSAQPEKPDGWVYMRTNSRTKKTKTKCLEQSFITVPPSAVSSKGRKQTSFLEGRIWTCNGDLFEFGVGAVLSSNILLPMYRGRIY